MKIKFLYFFILPVIIWITVWAIYPIAFNVYISLLNWSVFNPIPSFIGFTNYFNLITDKLFWQVLQQTIIYIIVIAPAHLLIGLFLALALNNPKWSGHKRLRTILLPLLVLPGPLAPISTGTIWKWAFNPAYSFLSKTPLQWLVDINWLGSTETAWLAVCFVEIWRGYPLPMLLLLSAASAIPEEYYEASKIDGASMWQRFRNITLPLLQNAMILVFVLNTIWVVTSFDIIFLLTGGGPSFTTVNLSLFVWMTGFEKWEFSYSAAAGTFMMLMFLAFSYLIIRRYRIE